MLIACSALTAALKALTVASAIQVTGVCPAYVLLQAAPVGTSLDFTQATPLRVDLAYLNGVTVTGYNSLNAPAAALNIVSSNTILVVQPNLTGPGTAGIVVLYSHGVEISGPLITKSKGDGIDVVGSTNVNVHDGACQDNVTTTVHPDCVQEWSLTGYPLQHIVVQNMTASGATQGFDLWDHSDYGADDIRFLDNHAAIAAGNCIGAINAHHLVVTGNDCHTLQGAPGPATLNISSSPGAVISGNTVGFNPS